MRLFSTGIAHARSGAISKRTSQLTYSSRTCGCFAFSAQRQVCGFTCARSVSPYDAALRTALINRIQNSSVYVVGGRTMILCANDLACKGLLYCYLSSAHQVCRETMSLPLSMMLLLRIFVQQLALVRRRRTKARLTLLR